MANFLKPFAGLRPKTKYAARVIAPPYDVLSTAEAVTLAQDNPYSFLHISKPEIDLPEATDPYAPEVYQTGANNLATLLQQNIFQRDESANYYIYRLSNQQYQQTGLVCLVSTAAYQKLSDLPQEQKRVRCHEHTLPPKEQDRIKLIEALQGQMSPVMLAYRDNDCVIPTHITEQPPEYDVTDHEGTTHQLWVVDNPELVQQLQQQFNRLPAIYVADGHHRCASAARVAEQHPDNPNYHYFLAALFPASELTILGYHRLIHSIEQVNSEQFLIALAHKFTLHQQAHPPTLTQANELGMYLNQQWYQLVYQAQPETDPIANLATTILHEHILAPVLDIHDPRNDQRIEYVGGSDALQRLTTAADRNPADTVAFTLPPTPIDALMDIADLGKTMPPKSTWFTPKLCDGLISYLY